MDRTLAPSLFRSAEKFDLLALIDSQRKDGPAAPREQAICAMLAEHAPIAHDRAGVPLPTRAALRDLQLTGTPSSGGNLGVQESPLSRLAGAARPSLIFDAAGLEAITVSDASSTSIPRWRGTSGGWVVEGQPLQEPTMTLTSVAARAHMAGTTINFSRRLKVTTSADLQERIIGELERRVRQVLEHGFIRGTGQDGQPIGLLRQAAGAVNIAGSSPTWSEIGQLLEALADADGDVGNAVWMTHPSTAVAMAQTERGAASGAYVMDWAPPAQWSVAGLPLFTSTQIPEGTVILLDRRAVMPVFFGLPHLLVDPYSSGNSITGAATIVVANHADLAVMEPDLVIIGS
jgi:hypothetical protein